jgi:hypothetical protein
MSKLLSFCLVLILASGVSQAIPLRILNTVTPSDYVVGEAGTGGAPPDGPGLAQVGWVVAAYVEDGTTSGFTWGEDTFIDSTTLFDGGEPGVQGIYNANLEGFSENDVVYVVVFNQSSVPTVGDTFWYAETVGSGDYTVTSQPTGQQYDFEGDGDWVFVPEPTGMALFALGLVTLVARRKLRK